MLQRLLSQTPYSGELSPLTLSELEGRQKTDMLLSSTLQSVYLVLHVVSLFVDQLSLKNTNNNLMFETLYIVSVAYTCTASPLYLQQFQNDDFCRCQKVGQVPREQPRVLCPRAFYHQLATFLRGGVKQSEDQSTVPCLQSWHLTTSPHPSLTNKKLSQRFCDQQKTTPAHSSMTQKPTL